METDREKSPDPLEDDLLSHSSGVANKTVEADVPEATDYIAISSRMLNQRVTPHIETPSGCPEKQ